MTPDEYLDTPEENSPNFEGLRKEIDETETLIINGKREADLIYAQEAELRRQLEVLRNRRDDLNTQKIEYTKNISRLRTIEYDILKEFEREQEIKRINGEITALEKELNELFSTTKFWDAAMPFQREDVLYAVNAWRMGLTGVLNANDMGLGKTYETLAMHHAISEMFQKKHDRVMSTIWVTKKNLITSTVRELQVWNPDIKIAPITGIMEKGVKSFLIELAHSNGMIVMTNYEALSTTPELILDYTWDMVIMDEVHKLKGGANSTPTLVWKAARDLVHKSRAHGGFYLPLSGSPVSNHPKEMWAYLHLFDPVRFPKVRDFERRYCSYFGLGIQVNPDLLIKAMKSQVIRRRRDEVSIQLPELTYDYRYPEMESSQRAVYELMKKEFYLWFDDQGEDVYIPATVIIAQITRLRQIALWPDSLTHKPTGSCKIDEAMDIIMELCETGEQVVVFSSQFNDPLFEIRSRVKNLDWTCEVINGETKNIDEICENFRQGKTNVLCINRMSGGEGLNLQKSDRWPGGSCHGIFIDLWWNPVANEQSEARLYRKGANMPVTMHIIQAENSVDNFIQNILTNKKAMIEGLMESKDLRKKDWRKELEGLL